MTTPKTGRPVGIKATDYRRRARQEELREKLKGLEYIRQLEEIDEKLRARTLQKDELDQVKVRIDLNFRRLAKVLPDERFLEIEATFSTHETALEELANALDEGTTGQEEAQG